MQCHGGLAEDGKAGRSSWHAETFLDGRSFLASSFSTRSPELGACSSTCARLVACVLGCNDSLASFPQY